MSQGQMTNYSRMTVQEQHNVATSTGPESECQLVGSHMPLLTAGAPSMVPVPTRTPPATHASHIHNYLPPAGAPGSECVDVRECSVKTKVPRKAKKTPSNVESTHDQVIKTRVESSLADIAKREKELVHRERNIKLQEREVADQVYQMAALKSLVTKYENSLLTITEEVRLLRLANNVSTNNAPHGTAKIHIRDDGVPCPDPVQCTTNKPTHCCHPQPTGTDTNLTSTIAIKVLESVIRLDEKMNLLTRNATPPYPQNTCHLQHVQPQPLAAYHKQAQATNTEPTKIIEYNHGRTGRQTQIYHDDLHIRGCEKAENRLQLNSERISMIHMCTSLQRQKRSSPPYPKKRDPMEKRWTD